MTEADHIDVFKKFDTHLVTSECSKKYCLKWTLKHFSRLPIKREFESPPLEPVPGYEWKLSFLNDGQELYLFLKNKSKIKMTPEICLSIFDSNGKRWHYEERCVTIEIDEKKDILKYSRQLYQDFQSLANDIFIIICNFKMCEVLTTEITDHKIGALLKSVSRMKLCADFKNLCVDKQHADVTFTVDGGQVLAHRAILCARSPVFNKMFCHPMDEQDQGSVKIDDVKLPVFKKLVDFLYSGEMEVENDIASTKALYYAADKYEILDLRKQCADTLLSTITVENIFGIVVIAYRHQDEYLKKGALSFICEYMNSVMESETWEEFVSSETKLASQVLKYCAKRIAFASKLSPIASN